jgi:ubiquitin carboxyl-terminal hydrolase 48
MPSAVQARQVLLDTYTTIMALKSASTLRSNMTSLLREMMPKHVCTSRLCRGETPEPELHEFETLIICDVKGFTSFSDGRSPFEVLNFVQRLFTTMDEVCKRHESIYKVETVGDGYLAVGGLSSSSSSSGPSSQAEQARLVEETAKFALEVMEAVATVPMDESVPDSFVQLRMGLHVGTIVTGITGKLSPRFCIFGDAVNTASQMESTGSPAMIHCSEAFARLLQVNEKWHDIAVQKRSTAIEVKGKGEMSTFWVSRGSTLDSFEIPLLQAGVHPSSVLTSFFRDEETEIITEPTQMV